MPSTPNQDATTGASASTIPPLRVYLRRSLDASAQAASLDTQRAECERRASAARLAWPARVEYTDDDRSGSDGTREAWNRLLREACAGDVVLAYGRDRLSRQDPLDAAVAIRDLLRRGVRVLYADGSEETLGDAITSLMTVMRGIGPAMEVERLRKRTSDALRERVRRGHVACGLAFGYVGIPVEETRRLQRDGRVLCEKRIAVSDEKAEIVRRIFTEYRDGQGRRAIARGLNADGIPSPGGSKWVAGVVSTIVADVRYTGRIIYGKNSRKREGAKSVRVAATAPPVEFDAPHLRIVDDALYAAVAARLGAQAATSSKGRGAPVRHALSGLLRCAACGRALTVECSSRRRGPARTIYVCRYARDGEGCAAPVVRFSAGALEAGVLAFVGRTLIPLAVEAVKEAVAEEERHAAAHRPDADGIRATLASAKARKGRAIKLAIATDGDGDVAAEVKRIAEEIARLERALAVAEAPADDLALRRLEAGTVARLEALGATIAAHSDGGEAAAMVRDALRTLTPALRVSLTPDGAYLVEGNATPDPAPGRDGGGDVTGASGVGASNVTASNHARRRAARQAA